jgi:hypothetical protein
VDFAQIAQYIHGKQGNQAGTISKHQKAVLSLNKSQVFQATISESLEKWEPGEMRNGD